MEIVYNKLVRDNIPEIIMKDNGKIPTTRILYDMEYKQELEKKILEEYHEVLEASGDDRIEELADMYELLKSLAEVEGSSIEKVAEVAKTKSLKKGGFKNKIYLEKVTTNE